MVQQDWSEEDNTWELVNPVGIVIERGGHTDCWIKLLKAQPYSAHHATTYEGWELNLIIGSAS